MVRPERFELPTLWFVAKYSIQLSYGRTQVVSTKTILRLSGFSTGRNCCVRPSKLELTQPLPARLPQLPEAA